MAREVRQKRDARFRIYSPKRVIVSSEGQVTEVKYFTELKNRIPKRFFNNFDIIVCKRKLEDQNNSSPANVLASAEDFIKNISPTINSERDEVCIVVDLDKWPEAQLAAVRQLCIQKKFMMLVSNPCFEIWLLLHHIDCSQLTEEEKNNLLGKQRHPRKDKKHPMKAKLSSVIEGYDCSNPDIDKFYPFTNIAIINSEKLDDGKDWPNNLGTKMHILMKKIPPFSGQR